MCCDDAPIFKSVWWLAPSSILINILCCWSDIDQLPLFSRLASLVFFRKASYSIKFGMFASRALCFQNLLRMFNNQICLWKMNNASFLINPVTKWRKSKIVFNDLNATWQKLQKFWVIIFSLQNNTKNNGCWPN